MCELFGKAVKTKSLMTAQDISLICGDWDADFDVFELTQDIAALRDLNPEIIERALAYIAKARGSAL